jgi:hypothetical protein
MCCLPTEAAGEMYGELLSCRRKGIHRAEPQRVKLCPGPGEERQWIFKTSRRWGRLRHTVKSFIVEKTSVGLLTSAREIGDDGPGSNQIRQSSDSQPKPLRVAFARKPSRVRVPMMSFAKEAADL